MLKIIVILALMFFSAPAIADQYDSNNPIPNKMAKCLFDKAVSDRSFNNYLDPKSAIRLVKTPECRESIVSYINYCKASVPEGLCYSWLADTAVQSIKMARDFRP